MARCHCRHLYTANDHDRLENFQVIDGASILEIFFENNSFVSNRQFDDTPTHPIFTQIPVSELVENAKHPDFGHDYILFFSPHMTPPSRSNFIGDEHSACAKISKFVGGMSLGDRSRIHAIAFQAHLYVESKTTITKILQDLENLERVYLVAETPPKSSEALGPRQNPPQQLELLVQPLDNLDYTSNTIPRAVELCKKDGGKIEVRCAVIRRDAVLMPYCGDEPGKPEDEDSPGSTRGMNMLDEVEELAEALRALQAVDEAIEKDIDDQMKVIQRNYMQAVEDKRKARVQPATSEALDAFGLPHEEEELDIGDSGNEGGPEGDEEVDVEETGKT
ncbi:hypothetical protein B0O99DRAFT_686421 [Bisporella sp. PMI_857]|nr:hypothetical protein B0O99DRAFT_686421 [Bisporella sp. PMI_857]